MPGYPRGASGCSPRNQIKKPACINAQAGFHVWSLLQQKRDRPFQGFFSLLNVCSAEELLRRDADEFDLRGARANQGIAVVVAPQVDEFD